MGLKSIRVSLVKKLIDINEMMFFERKLRVFYQKKEKINTVIDVGANKGQTIDFFLSLNKQCIIYAIEPNPVLHKILVKKYKDNGNIKIFNVGISNVVGEKLFFENVLDYTSTFEELNLQSPHLKKKAKILGVKDDSLVKKSYPVNVITLSKFIDDNDIRQTVDVLKIDTEGHEFYCLQGLFLENKSELIRFIQLENHNNNMYKNKVSFDQIEDALNSNSFFECGRINHGFGDFDEVIYSFKENR